MRRRVKEFYLRGVAGWWLTVLIPRALCSCIHKDDKTGIGLFRGQVGRRAPGAAQQHDGVRLGSGQLHSDEPWQLCQYLLPCFIL